MFKGLFKKKINKHDIDKIKVSYEGGVISADYEARSINRTDVNDQDYPYHSLFPHGNGKITYKIGKGKKNMRENLRQVNITER